MTVFRKVFRDQRDPKNGGIFFTNIGEATFGQGTGIWRDGYGGECEIVTDKVLWWLEEVELPTGDQLHFTKEDATPDFVDGINYILDKLKA